MYYWMLTTGFGLLAFTRGYYYFKPMGLVEWVCRIPKLDFGELSQVEASATLV